MNYNSIIQMFRKHPFIKDTIKWMNSTSKCLHISGLQASGKCMMLGAIQQSSQAKMLIVMEDAESAAYCYNDINRSFPSNKCGIACS